MKVEAKKVAPVFPPVRLSLTLESQKELDTLHAVLMHRNVADALRSGGIEPEDIRHALRDAGSDSTCNEWKVVKPILERP